MPVVPGALGLGGGRVKRKLIRLVRDEHGQEQLVEEKAVLALATCRTCGHRCRVLPSDVLPRKVYALPVIEHLAAKYVAGDGSLREISWSLLGERTPEHTTVHAWTEGLGAHVLGRDAVGGEPHSAMVVETTARRGPLAPLATPSIDPRRYRSEPRHERLLAVALILLTARATLGPDASAPLSGWLRLAIVYGVASPLSFRTGLRCTAIEQVDSSAPRSCAPCPTDEANTLPNRTRSPPGASSRSPRSSIPHSDPRSDGA